VTAAHCFSEYERRIGRDFRPEETRIILGTNDCRGEDVGFDASIRRIIQHPDYEQNGQFDNDIALVELNEYVAYTDLIQPICLESDEFLDEFFFHGHGTNLGRIVGCGRLSEKEGMPAHLREVHVPYVSRNQCERNAPTTSDGGQITFTDTMICAGYMRAMKGDACGGDSGGSYAIDLKEGAEKSVRWVLGGIVSFGKGCDRKGEYGYYANAGKFYTWIKRETGLDTD
jgi:secreted trypsin-like serine protease